MKSGDAFCRLRSAFPFLVLLKAMLKKTILCFLSVSLLLFFPALTSCRKDAVSDPGDGVGESAAEDETADGGEEVNPYTYLGPGYTFSDGTLTAAPTTKDKAETQFSGAFMDAEAENYRLDVTLTLDSLTSSAGVLFAASESQAYDGIEGYAFTLRDKRVYLYDLTGSSLSGLMPAELASKSVERPKTGAEIRLRVEKSGNVYRCYYLDDAEGVEPWPEFEFVLTDHRGKGVGAADNGHGAVFTSLSCVAAPEKPLSGKTYRNPVFRDLQAADPGVLKADGKYYCYSTSAPIGYYVYVSDDLVNWKNEGLCMSEAWGLSRSGYYWAPEVVRRADGKFVMVCSVEEHLGFAVADSPLGPFIPEKSWTFDKTIDGHIFLDEDGRGYLFYVSWRSGHDYGIWACELEDDLVTVKPETEVPVISPTDAWEQVSGRVTEGPFVLKHSGLYYLTYSGNGYDAKEYAVGYAVSKSPLGPYEKYKANPILSYTSKLYGPGHHSFTTSPDGSELIIVYHTHASTTAVHPRTICIDRARFAPTDAGVDRLEIFGPTHTAQEYPK